METVAEDARDRTDVPNAAWDLKTEIYEGDVLFLEWAATAATTKVEDGITPSCSATA
jgi:hypothetical protein